MIEGAVKQPHRWWKMSFVCALCVLSVACTKQNWQEQACIDAIDRESTYSFEVIEINTRPHYHVDFWVEVSGEVEIENKFGARRKHYFRCTVSDKMRGTQRERDLNPHLIPI